MVDKNGNPAPKNLKLNFLQWLKKPIHKTIDKLTESKQPILEIGEGSSKPFKSNFLGKAGNKTGWYIEGKNSEGENIDVILEITVYEYDRGKGIPVQVFNELGKDTLKSASVDFRVDYGEEAPHHISYAEVNDKVYMYRLMATLRNILLQFIQENNIDIIEYAPIPKGTTAANSDKGEGRNKLYSLFLKKMFPNAKRINSNWYDDQNIYFVLK